MIIKMMKVGVNMFLIIAAVFLVVGCGDSQQPASPSEKTSISTPFAGITRKTETVAANWINEVIALRIVGRNAEAMALLLDEMPPGQDIDIPQFLTFSEKEFQGLPSNVSSKLMQTLPKMSDDILSFAKEARALVQNTSESEKRKARALRLKRFGEDLSRDNRLAVFQMIGNSINRWKF
jgi:hypothetical protein